MLHCVFVSLALSVPVSAAPTCPEGALLSFKDAVVEGCSVRRLDQVEVPLTAEGKPVRLEGEVRKLRWSHRPNVPLKELVRRAQQQLEAKGFTLIFVRPEGSLTTLAARRDLAPEAYVLAEMESFNLGEKLVAEVLEVRNAPFAPKLEKRPEENKRDAKGCLEPLGLGRVTAGVLDSCEPMRFGEVELPLDEKTKRAQEGEVFRVRFTHQESTSPLEVIRAYAASLADARFAVVHQGVDGNERWLTATRDANGREEWVHVASGAINGGELTQTYLTVVRSSPLPVGEGTGEGTNHSL
ncbi:MAG: hypothetical protein ACOZIN_03930 [Myxococcota bacterium]